MAFSSGTLVHSLGHNTLGKADIVVQTIFLGICLIVVALRLWSRRLQWLSLQVNDCLILSSTFLMVGRYVVEIILVVLCGMGLHPTEIIRVGGNEITVKFLATKYAGDLLWLTVVCLTQLSILDYYVRNFSQRTITLLSYITMSLCLALWSIGFFVTAFLCNPPRKIWHENTAGHCGNRQMLHTGVLACEIILNFFILALAVPFTWRMPLSRPRKFGLVGVQALGLIVIILISVRTKLEFDSEPTNQTKISASKSALACIAPILGIIAACLPITAPAIQKMCGVPSRSFSTQTLSPDPGSRYWNTRVLEGMQLDEPEMPLVTVHPHVMAKAGYLAPGHIRITSDWEIHSSRGSARIERPPMQRM
ncbi:unnamed protein product [Penicillium olsonii]|uniref:Rhodopsin domain-containing protein n=1 Tax=Penicillium olsonii TaxID=99116 RepID=A0A9W4HBH2_PENOL|nr:unnamed protein product [Penicillium olsonii]CAG7975294.1 unnamed protein product [Penicillium olsonii]